MAVGLMGEKAERNAEGLSKAIKGTVDDRRAERARHKALMDEMVEQGEAMRSLLGEMSTVAKALPPLVALLERQQNSKRVVE